VETISRIIDPIIDTEEDDFLNMLRVSHRLYQRTGVFTVGITP
jgi:hypothetical protein